MHRKALLIPATILAVLFMAGFTPAMAAGESISTSKSNIKANVPIDFDCAGLTVSTYYTIYLESTLKGNQSTSSTTTTLEFKIVVPDDYLDQWVTISLRTANGTVTLATVELEVVAVVPQYTIDMIAGFLPLLMVFSVVFGLMGGIIVLVMKIVK